MRDASYYATIADQDLDRTLRSDTPADVAEDLAKAQVNATLALAAALDRLAVAIETRA